MRGGAILVSVKREVASSAEDPEWAILLQMVWCLVVTFETIRVNIMCAFTRSEE